jgi:hypothetical protein
LLSGSCYYNLKFHPLENRCLDAVNDVRTIVVKFGLVGCGMEEDNVAKVNEMRKCMENPGNISFGIECILTESKSGTLLSS